MTLVGDKKRCVLLAVGIAEEQIAQHHEDRHRQTLRLEEHMDAEDVDADRRQQQRGKRHNRPQASSRPFTRYNRYPDACDYRGVPVRDSARVPAVRALLDEHRRRTAGQRPDR